jgi:hypothetical protein
VTAPATASRSDVLRGRIRALDDLKTRTTAAPGGAAEPGIEAKKTALAQRIDTARAGPASELARRDRMEAIRSDAMAIRRDALTQHQTIARADAAMGGMKQEFLGKYPQRPLKAEHLSPQDRARYQKAKDARDAAQKKFEKDKEEYAKKKEEYAEEKKKAEEQEKADGQTEGDVADPCVSCVASEVEKLEEEAKKAEEERLALARELTEKGGSGDDADKELVAQELAKLPKSALEQMKANGTKVVACRGSVTDYDSSLSGVQPRGWDPGDTWDTVPGMYDKTNNKVVIATRGHGTPGGARVPVTGDGHGCANLTIHESMHALDSGGSGAARSAGTDFNTARTADLPNLGTYETQAGSAGQEETWAESGARYYGGGGGTTNLDNYWRNNPPGAPPAAAAPAATGATGGGP